jgi:hypothetical protein
MALTRGGRTLLDAVHGTYASLIIVGGGGEEGSEIVSERVSSLGWTREKSGSERCPCSYCRRRKAWLCLHHC